MPLTLNIKGKLLDLSKPKIMAVLNITPDSYYEKSRAQSIESALAKASQMIEEGADILDIGACSTRPGSDAPSAEEEWNRLKEILPELVKAFPAVPISIDTYRSMVAHKAVEQGAAIINDVSMGEWDSNMLETAAQLKMPYILTHSKGLPNVMQQNPKYNDVIAEVFLSLSDKIAQLKALGLNDIILDLGFGFGKSVEHNYALLSHLAHFHEFKLPILVGISRKSMIYKPLNSIAEEVLPATSALHFAALQQGAHLVRVHDVREAKQVIHIFELYKQNASLHAV